MPKFAFNSLKHPICALLLFPACTPIAPGSAKMTTRSAPDYFVPLIKHGFQVESVDGRKDFVRRWKSYYLEPGNRTIKAFTVNGQSIVKTDLIFDVKSESEYLLTGEYQRENVIFRVIDQGTRKVVAERRGEEFATSNMPLIITVPMPIR